MSATNPVPGLYGKLPGFGDFLSRRLPRSFIDPWDAWLQSGMAASREQLGSEWLEVYLTSPLWRFVLSPGICGAEGWAGVLMPSVDRVGRYFPMTLAAPVDPSRYANYLLGYASRWFDDLEKLALEGLNDAVDIEQFDQSLQRLEIPDFMCAGEDNTRPDAGAAARRAWRIDLADLEEMPKALAGMGNLLMDRLIPIYSIWASSGSERARAALLVCDGLPPVDGFTSLLNGHWQQRGWKMHFDRIPDLPNPPPASSPELPSPIQTQPASAGGAWESFGISVVGNRRKINEDAFLARPDMGLWVVADGMGGHQAGDVASRSIVDALAALEKADDLDLFVQQVKTCLEQVNDDLHRLGAERLGGQVVGSTVVAMLAQGQRCVAIWAGDSRLYRYRSGQLEQLTEDHSLLDELVKSGFMTAEQMAQQGNNNIITRAVGAEESLDLEVGEFPVQEGDIFVLCSDGLVKELNSQEIVSRLISNSCELAAQSLIDGALANGGRDNISVIVIRVGTVS